MSAPCIAFYFPPFTNEISNSIGGFTFRIMHGIDVLRNECDVTLVTLAKTGWTRPMLIELAPKCSSLLG